MSAATRFFADEKAACAARGHVVVRLKDYPGRSALDLTRISIAEHACRMALERLLGGAEAVLAAAEAGGHGAGWNGAVERAAATGLATLPVLGGARFEVRLLVRATDPQGSLF